MILNGVPTLSMKCKAGWDCKNPGYNRSVSWMASPIFPAKTSFWMACLLRILVQSSSMSWPVDLAKASAAPTYPWCTKYEHTILKIKYSFRTAVCLHFLINVCLHFLNDSCLFTFSNLKLCKNKNKNILIRFNPSTLRPSLTPLNGVWKSQKKSHSTFWVDKS